MTLLSLVVFIVSTWLAVRAKSRRVKRTAALLSLISASGLVYYTFFAGVPN